MGEATGRVVSREDQLIHSLISFGAEGFVDLLAVLDAGWLLHRHADSLDCAYVAGRVRDRGLYPAFYFTLEHVCGLLKLPRVMERFDRPPGWRRHMFHMWWRPKEADYSGETEPTAGRLSFVRIYLRGKLCAGGLEPLITGDAPEDGDSRGLGGGAPPCS